MNFVVLQNISSNMALLCHYDSTIIDNDNNITNIEGSNVISNVKLNISRPELKEVMYGGIEWNYKEIEVDIT